MQYTNNEKAAAKMLIRFYNMQAGTALRSGSEENPDSNINRALDTLGKLDGDIAFVKAHIRQYIIENPKENSFAECMMTCSKVVEIEAEPETKEVPLATAAVPVTDQQVNYSMGILEQAVIQLISKTQTERIESEIMGQVEQSVRDFIKSEYGAIERKIVTVVDGNILVTDLCHAASA